MELTDLKQITGIDCMTNAAWYTASIQKARLFIEGLLGYTLTPLKVDTNFYNELGKMTTEGGDYTTENLTAPDPVVYAYRLYRYNKHDRFFLIDPATEIHAVKLVRNNVTMLTLDPDNYRVHSENGFIKSIEKCSDCYWSCMCYPYACQCRQLAVDATWLWPTYALIPDDMKQIWADAALYYADTKRGIRSESLGPHSYSKFGESTPYTDIFTQSTIKKYMGGNGSLIHSITI